MACGVEVMSRIDRINSSKKLGLGVTIPKEYFADSDDISVQRERIADKWEITRDDTDAFGESQQRAGQAWNEDRFAGQWISVDAPVLDEEATWRHRCGDTRRRHSRTSLEKLGQLKPVAREDGVHTMETLRFRWRSSSADDDAERAEVLGSPRARVVDTCLVGVDPVLMLTGPMSNRRLLDRSGLSIDDIDNQKSPKRSSVVLAWAKEVGGDLAKTNPNGAIALGHPSGRPVPLMTKSLCELERTSGRYGPISMCCVVSAQEHIERI